MSASVPEAAVCVHGRGVSSAHDGFKLLPFPLKGLHTFLYGLARDGNLPGALSVRACGHEVDVDCLKFLRALVKQAHDTLHPVLRLSRGFPIGCSGDGGCPSPPPRPSHPRAV